MAVHTTAQLKMKPGNRANQQASVAVPRPARTKQRPQHANDRHGQKP